MLLHILEEVNNPSQRRIIEPPMSILLRLNNPDLEKHQSTYWLICKKKKYVLAYILFLSYVFVVGTILISLGHLPKLIPLLVWESFSDEQKTRNVALMLTPITIEC